MARKAKNKGKSKATKPASAKPTKKSDGTDAAPAPRRDIRRYLYASVDIVMAIVYVMILSAGLTSQHASTNTMLWALVALVLVLGACMFVRNKWSWRVAVGACGAILIMAVVMLVLILMSAAFLSGVYGAFGKAASTFALLAAALIIELIALLPAFQLKYLLTRAGRRSFGLEPIWK
jgi:cation transport ATPase